MKARSIVIGLKTWRAVRSIGSAIVTFLLPTGPLDVLIAAAFGIVFGVIELVTKPSRSEREKQKALEALFKQSETIQRWIETRFKPDPWDPERPTVADELTAAWDKSSKVSGFLYARIEAQIELETFIDMTLQEVEALTRYRVAKITNVKATPDEFAFELKEVARTQLEPTVEEMFKAREKGGFKKVLITRHLKYTMPTPVYTPFDIVISKINNLFLDTTYFVWEFDEFGEGMLKNFTGFNYKTSYKEQFFVEVDFPAQVSKPVCIDVLAYLHWAAKHLSRHALEQADIEGHFENPQKAHERRVMLLDHVYWGTDTGKPFRWLLQKISRMVKSDYATEDVIEGLRHVKEGVEAITFDLSRIWEKRLEHEYLYTGPK